jgi:hypothetical protein
VGVYHQSNFVLGQCLCLLGELSCFFRQGSEAGIPTGLNFDANFERNQMSSLSARLMTKSQIVYACCISVTNVSTPERCFILY